MFWSRSGEFYDECVYVYVLIKCFDLELEVVSFVINVSIFMCSYVSIKCFDLLVGTGMWQKSSVCKYVCLLSVAAKVKSSYKQRSKCRVEPGRRRRCCERSLQLLCVINKTVRELFFFVFILFSDLLLLFIIIIIIMDLLWHRSTRAQQHLTKCA